MIKLREYQEKDIAKLRIQFRSGRRRVVYAARTGSGKSVAAAWMIKSAVERGNRVLVVSHRQEIHRQLVSKLKLYGLSVFELTAGQKEIDASARVIVASQQTLARRKVPFVDFVVIDEAHQGVAQHKRLQQALPAAWFLLLTATPQRLDGAPLPADVIVEGPSIVELQQSGHLVRTQVYTVESPDLSHVPIVRGDFSNRMMEIAYSKPKLIGSIVDHYQNYCVGRRTMLFASGVEHSKKCSSMLNQAGIRSLHVDGSTPARVRAETWRKLQDHEIDVVCSVGVAIEGLDIPEVSAVIWARATASLTVWCQGNGRAMRPGGSEDTIIVDAGGNVWRHGLPETEHTWSLSTRVGAVKQPSQVYALRHCGHCLAIWSSEESVSCPRCGANEVQKRVSPRTQSGELVKISEAELARRRKSASKDTPPRPCPVWALKGKGLWDRLESKRHREGYELGDGGPYKGWTAAMWRRIMRTHAAA